MKLHSASENKPYSYMGEFCFRNYPAITQPAKTTLLCEYIFVPVLGDGSNQRSVPVDSNLTMSIQVDQYLYKTVTHEQRGPICICDEE